MNGDKRKKLKEDYKNRMPEMGIVSFSSRHSNDIFVGISRDTQSVYNSNLFKLKMGNHSNKKMLELWKQYGEGAFDYKLEVKLKYDNPQDDQTRDLEDLLELYLEENPNALKIDNR